MAFLDENGVAQLWAAVKDRLAGAFDSVDFDIAEQAANLVSGDSIATAFGKLAKNYTSLVDQISNLSTNKFDKNKVVANYTTQGTGYALDASLGPAIKAKMDLADTLNTRVGTLENKYLINEINVNAVDTDSSGGTASPLEPNKSRWYTFPVTKDGYTLVAVLGYYFHTSNNGVFTADISLYYMQVNATGVTIGVRAGQNGSWTNPGANLRLLWKKNS